MEFLQGEKDAAIRFLKLIFNRWKTIVIAALLSGILALVATTFVKPTYLSYGIIFPTPSHHSVDLIKHQEFGYDLDVDRLVQTLESVLIRDSINARFNLTEHFGIDTNAMGWQDNLRMNFIKSVRYEGTKNLSVAITAELHTPEMSADVVNAIIDMIDPIRSSILKKNTYQAMLSIEGEYLQKSQTVAKLMDTIQILRKNNTSAALDMLYQEIKQKEAGIAKDRAELNALRSKLNFRDLDSKIEMLDELMSDARQNKASDLDAKSAEKELAALNAGKARYYSLTDKLESEQELLLLLREEFEKMTTTFEPHVGSLELDQVVKMYENELNQLIRLKNQYEEARFAYERPIPGVYVVTRAKPSYKKTGPSYLTNAMAGLFGGMFISVLLLVFLDKLGRVKKHLSS